MTSSKFYLKIFFIFSKIILLLSVWWINFQIFLNFVNLKIINRKMFSIIQWLFNFLIEIASKIISIINSEDSLVKIDICCYIKIFPIIEIHDANFFWNFLSVYENSLSYSRIFYSWFSYMNSFVS